MLFNDPEAPTTITRPYDYGQFTGGPVHGLGRDRRRLDRAPRPPRTGGRRVTDGRDRDPDRGDELRADRRVVDAAGAARASRRRTSWWSTPKRSSSGNTLAVMGPQLGYYYPEIVQQIDLHGPGIEAQGAAVPGWRCTSSSAARRTTRGA